MSRFNVGGVLLERPFKIRRLCHFGINAIRMADALHFYNDLLGLRITDVQEATRGGREIKKEWSAFGDLNGYFMRYAHDHHAFVLYNHRFRQATDRLGRMKEGVTINQITWQVGSLSETVDGHNWFVEQGLKVVRSGRDMPGSNWHSYLMDPEWHQNEICWGMEQIGWSGHSKPHAMSVREFSQTPPLPQKSEYAEVNDALADEVDLLSGQRDRENLPLRYDVQGILLARPFRIVRHGPVNLFVADLDAAEAWYRDVLGFVKTEEVVYQGHRCLYFRANTEHHSLALYPVALRSVLGLRADTSMAWFGLQLANYRQLLDAITFLKSHGLTLRELPPELSPGMDHTILVLDPDGHAMHLYWSMEQIGWDGHPRPAEQRRKIVAGAWPDSLAENADSYAGEPLLGPW